MYINTINALDVDKRLLGKKKEKKRKRHQRRWYRKPEVYDVRIHYSVYYTLQAVQNNKKVHGTKKKKTT